MANDYDLGIAVHEHLVRLGLETPMLWADMDTPTGRFEAIQASMMDVMDELGLDRSDDSLKDTPKRVAKMYCEEIFSGLDYQNFPACSVFKAPQNLDEMIAVQDIEVKSMCEHHFMPFMGTAVVAYIPSNKGILGLSKFNRIVDFFARRPQVQERLTEQVAAALQYILDTDDVAVTMQAKHLCVSFRGVKDFMSSTVTSKLAGKFRTVPELRQEFLALTKK